MRLKPLYQQDKQQAVREGEANLILRQLNRRLGQLSSDIATQVSQLPIEQLENLGEALLDFQNESDLRKWLEGDRL